MERGYLFVGEKSNVKRIKNENTQKKNCIIEIDLLNEFLHFERIISNS